MKIEIIEKWFEVKQTLNKEQFELLKFMFEFIQQEKTAQVKFNYVSRKES